MRPPASSVQTIFAPSGIVCFEFMTPQISSATGFMPPSPHTAQQAPQKADAIAADNKQKNILMERIFIFSAKTIKQIWR
jgi:hypothetical protein